MVPRREWIKESRRGSEARESIGRDLATWPRRSDLLWKPVVTSSPQLALVQLQTSEVFFKAIQYMA